MCLCNSVSASVAKGFHCGLPDVVTELCEVFPELLGGLEPAVPLLWVGTLVQQGLQPPLFGNLSRGVVQQPPRGAPPRGVSGQKVLTNGVIVVVHSDTSTKNLFREGQTSFFITVIKLALVPHVPVLRFICEIQGDGKTSERGEEKPYVCLNTIRSSIHSKLVILYYKPVLFKLGNVRALNSI